MSLNRKTGFFILTQLAVLFAATFVVCHGLQEGDRRLSLPQFADVPENVSPQYDDSRVVTDGQLRDVLTRLRPPALADFPKVNHIDHALRFWGLDASFPGSDRPSGFAMREFLVDDTVFRTTSDNKAQSLLRTAATGVAFRTQEGRNTSSHEDHTLATLAEIGTPLSFPLNTPAGPRPMHDALQHALQTFAIDQPEYEWSSITFGLYRVNDSQWFTSEGYRLTWDRIAKRLMRQRMGQGCCYGGHRLFSLTILLRLDEREPLFSSDTRNQIVEHLCHATRLLVANQSPEGAMDGAWPGEPILKNDKLTGLGQQLLSTGHALEWWAMAPEEVHPPRETVVRAGQWLSRKILEMSDRQIADNYTFLTHAGRALVLWRGTFPAEFWQRHAIEITRQHEQTHDESKQAKSPVDRFFE